MHRGSRPLETRVDKKEWEPCSRTEGSNVSVVEEFINLIVSQRAYEANSKVVKAADDMYQQVNNITQ